MNFFSANTRRDSLIIGLLLLSYAGLIFAIPVPGIFDFEAVKSVFLLGFLLPGLGIFFYLKLIREPESEILIPFVFKIFFLYAFSLLLTSLLNFDKCYDPFLNLAHLAIAGLLLIAVYNLVNSFERLKTVVFFMALVAGIVSLLGILEYSGIVFNALNLNTGQIIKVTFGNQNFLGGYLIISLPFLLTLFFCSEKKIVKFIFLLFCIFAIFAAVLTGSRMTFLVIFFSLGLYLLLAFVFVFHPSANKKITSQKEKLVIFSVFIAAIAILGGYLIYDNTMVQRFKYIMDPAKFMGIRMDMYQTALAIWLDNPRSLLFGNGSGSFYKLHFMKAPYDLDCPIPRSWGHVHNEILEILVEGGIFSLALYAIMVLSTLYVLQKIAKNNSLAKDKRLIAISLAVSILAFQVHGVLCKIKIPNHAHAPGGEHILGKKYRGVLTDLASLFKDIDFDTWIALKNQGASKAEYPFIAEKLKDQILSARDSYQESNRRKDLKRLISLYEQLARYSPRYEQSKIRKKLLPLYLKDFQFKKYAFWKQWLKN